MAGFIDKDSLKSALTEMVTRGDDRWAAKGSSGGGGLVVTDTEGHVGTSFAGITARGDAHQDGTPSEENMVPVQVVCPNNLINYVSGDSNQSDDSETMFPTDYARFSSQSGKRQVFASSDSAIIFSLGGTFTMSFECELDDGESTGTVYFKTSQYEDDSDAATVPLTDGLVSVSRTFENGQASQAICYIEGGGDFRLWNMQLTRGSTVPDYVPGNCILLYAETPNENDNDLSYFVELPSKGWVASLPNGVADTLSLDMTGSYTWTTRTASSEYLGTNSYTHGVDALSVSGKIDRGQLTVYDNHSNAQTETFSIKSMGYDESCLIPGGSVVEIPDLADVVVKSFNDGGLSTGVIAYADNRFNEVFAQISDLQNAIEELSNGD